jgi:hypothetical protein
MCFLLLYIHEEGEIYLYVILQVGFLVNCLGQQTKTAFFAILLAYQNLASCFDFGT